MNSLGGRYEPSGEAHAPGQTGGNAVVAISGDQTSQPPHAVANRNRRGRQVEHGQAAELSMRSASMRSVSMRSWGLASLPHQHRYPHQQPAKPGESRTVKQ